ncbi:MAG: MopE-related protein [Pseudomonadota bacterium]
MKRRVLALASTAFAFLAGCDRGNVSDYTGYVADYSGWEAPDDDGDGYDADADCDDDDAGVNPGVVEVCDDNIDNDCDGLIDADDVDDCPE